MAYNLLTKKQTKRDWSMGSAILIIAPGVGEKRSAFKTVVGGLALGTAAVLGWRYWKKHKS